jgi:alkanesulfonate monooxygenase SsuD/methylene tetrahydromethanopterin reductase-like flavin-dependent oxidoreductase (luciferase family)
MQQPLPPTIVATRSDDTVQYAAANRLGLGISYDRVDDAAKVTEKYKQWCQEAGWQPTPEQLVYRGSILLAETDQQANAWLERLEARGLGHGTAMRPAVTRAVQAARAGQKFDLRQEVASNPRGDGVREARGLANYIGGPDTVVKQLKAFHDQCGMGVVDLAFQQPGIDHQAVMKEIDLFGREVLPRMREF